MSEPVIKQTPKQSERSETSVFRLSDNLWGADPDCDHDIEYPSGGGVRCKKCSGWFCF